MTKHYQEILKRVVEKLSLTLSTREFYIVANDPDSELARWFNKTAKSEALAKYESPTYWMNDPATFQYDPDALVPFCPDALAAYNATNQPAPKPKRKRKAKAAAPELAIAA